MDHLRIAGYLAELLDNKFSFGKFGFGLDPLLDFLPVGGDVIALILSLYILWIAYHYDAPSNLRSRMLANIVFDFVLGLIPVAGWIADFFYKANSKNMQLLKEWLAHRPIDGQVLNDQRIAAAS